MTDTGQDHRTLPPRTGGKNEAIVALREAIVDDERFLCFIRIVFRLPQKVCHASIAFVHTPITANSRTEDKLQPKKHKFAHNIEESRKIVYNEAYERTGR